MLVYLVHYGNVVLMLYKQNVHANFSIKWPWLEVTARIVQIGVELRLLNKHDAVRLQDYACKSFVLLKQVLYEKVNLVVFAGVLNKNKQNWLLHSSAVVDHPEELKVLVFCSFNVGLDLKCT
jgi:hypothetical protein